MKEDGRNDISISDPSGKTATKHRDAATCGTGSPVWSQVISLHVPEIKARFEAQPPQRYICFFDYIFLNTINIKLVIA